ncbi:MAG: iron-containing alcohol dehydrogenase [Actinomycetota bacterium]|nr:iron-containing alcohol dehydrogenase [Actinomycetota bacterium]
MNAGRDERVSPSTGDLSRADPTDLNALREALAASDPDGKLNPIGMSRIEIGPEALEVLADMVSELTRSERVVLVADATPAYRDGEDLKERVARTLGESFEMERAVIGAGRDELHADEEAVAEVEEAIDGAGCVVSVGSGTITDLCKMASRNRDSLPFVAVQSAGSVNGFSDDFTVLLKGGAKRTVPSRYPDALLIDLGVLAEAPHEMNAAGFGDLLASFTAPADWYLAYLVGMGDYHQAPITPLLEQAHELLDEAAALEGCEPEALYKLARVLTLSGLACGTAGSTAPGSGVEHLVSHLLDMSAVQFDHPFAFHGAQVGVATVPVSAAWEVLFSEFDPLKIDPDDCFPEPEEMEPVVREAFARIDPSGGVGEECWGDYSKKIERWKNCRPQFEDFLKNWPRYKDELKEMVVPSERLGNALKESGAPARFGELDPPVSEETAFWALRDCHLMRNRFTLADLLFFIGWWDDGFVERLFDRDRSVGGGL